MKITIDLEESELTTAETAIIKNSLNISSDNDFKEALKKITKSAFLEYKRMFTEKGIPSKAEEVLQDRLFFLIVNYFSERLPLESEIATIFQLTHSQSKTLLKNTKSRYRPRIQEQLKYSIRHILRNHDKRNDKFYFEIKSDVLKEEINLRLNQEAPACQKILAVKGTAGEYYCPEDTFNELKKIYNLQ